MVRNFSKDMCLFYKMFGQQPRSWLHLYLENFLNMNDGQDFVKNWNQFIKEIYTCGESTQRSPHFYRKALPFKFYCIIQFKFD